MREVGAIRGKQVARQETEDSVSPFCGCFQQCVQVSQVILWAWVCSRRHRMMTHWHHLYLVKTNAQVTRMPERLTRWDRDSDVCLCWSQPLKSIWVNNVLEIYCWVTLKILHFIVVKWIAIWYSVEPHDNVNVIFIALCFLYLTHGQVKEVVWAETQRQLKYC